MDAPAITTLALIGLSLVMVLFAGLQAARIHLEATRVPPPAPPQPITSDAAAIVAAILSASTARDAAFFAASQQVIDKALVQMQGTMQVLRNTQIVGGVPLELEMQRVELELAKQHHARKVHEEQLEAYRLAAQGGRVPPPPAGAKPPQHPLA